MDRVESSCFIMASDEVFEDEPHPDPVRERFEKKLVLVSKGLPGSVPVSKGLPGSASASGTVKAKPDSKTSDL
ncbi:hypothetical protein CRENBAI_019900 [Crenichthys baileyi]|uniref:Uncharacterized protein n=1 Tax=Crenichthys baileyi TaxID=28760 RepID=A0AAV9STD4_9TELE